MSVGNILRQNMSLLTKSLEAIREWDTEKTKTKAKMGDFVKEDIVDETNILHITYSQLWMYLYA